jgi:hypothetical protein
MPVDRAKKLYEDLRIVAKLTPEANVPDSHIAIFNAILAEAKKKYPQDAILQAIPEAKKDTFGNMLVPAGQLSQILEEIALAEWPNCSKSKQRNVSSPAWPF